MSKTERKKQIRKRITMTMLLFISFIVIFLMGAKIPATNTYAIQTNSTEGFHYKYVTERTEKAVYIGKIDGFCTFLTSDGNEWSVDAGTYKKGKTYTLKMHDNGTENDITDDVITAIK